MTKAALLRSLLRRPGLVPMVGAPQAYAAHASVGFGVWLDNESGSRGWDAQKPEKNFFMRSGSFAANPARKIAMAILAASDGWKKPPPMRIQRCAPFSVTPTCGTNTSPSRMREPR